MELRWPPGRAVTNVMIGFMPAWRAMIDQHACPMVSITGPDGAGSVMMGSPTVFINFMMACRMGDIVIEKPGLAMGPANPIIMGCPTVMIGEVGMPAVISPDAGGGGMGGVSASTPGEAGSAAQALTKASESGAATVVVGGNQTLAQAAGGGSGSGSGSGAAGGSRSGGAGGSGGAAGAGAGAAADSSSDPKKTWVEIQLLDPDGKPVPNEPYRITAPDGSISEGCTDGNGVARVDGIDPGTCKITFTALDQQAWSKG